MSKRCALVAVLVWSALSVVSAGPSSLTGVRYSNADGHSKLTLSFEGGVRYSILRQGDKLFIGFPGTRLATPPGSARLRFKEGYVRAVSMDRVGQDSISALVVLRAGAEYTLARPAEGGALVMEVEPGAAVIVPVVRKVKTPAAQPHAGLVDIPTLARTQVEQTPAPVQQPAKVEPAPVQQVVATTPKVSALPIPAIAGGAILLAALTTFGVIMIIRRKSSRHSVVYEKKSVVAGRPNSADAIQEMFEKASQSGREEESPEESPVFDDSVQMARTFHRGTDELGLAMTLQGKSAPDGKRLRVEKIVKNRGSRTQRRTAARKLGVSLGEVELALQLKKMQSRGNRKEGGE